MITGFFGVPGCGKTTLAQEYANDRATYTKLKDNFFQSIIDKALS